MLDRNRRIKKCPERFQDCREQFDIIVTVEERIYDQVLEHMESRDVMDNRPVHIFNVDIEDNHEEALMGAFLITDMINMVKINKYSYKLLLTLLVLYVEYQTAAGIQLWGVNKGRYLTFNLKALILMMMNRYYDENIYENIDKTICFMFLLRFNFVAFVYKEKKRHCCLVLYYLYSISKLYIKIELNYISGNYYFRLKFMILNAP